MINMSMPLARSKRLSTDPLSCRNFSCSLRCWKSNPNNQTSSSLILRFRPTEIRGDIQETVRNCHRSRSSSGLRKFSEGASPILPIPSLDKQGSRVGMDKMIIVDTTAAPIITSCATWASICVSSVALEIGNCTRNAEI